jgi:hypothetical protein
MLGTIRETWSGGGAAGPEAGGTARALAPGGGAIRESRTRPYATSSGGIGGGTGSPGCRQGVGPGRAARFVNLGQDPMKRRAVGLAAAPEAGDADQRSGPVRTGRFANLDKDPMKRRAAGLAEGPDPADADQRPGPVQTGRFANLDKDPMKRRAVG